MATDDAADSAGDAAAGESASGDRADGAESEGWRRWLAAVAAAGRWALDVFRGHARSRHLDNRER